MSGYGDLRVACAQILHTPGQPDCLLDAHQQAITRAEQDDIDLIVFPETSLTGYPGAAEDVISSAIDLKDQTLTRLADMCQSTTAVVGFVERGDDTLFYNSIAWLHKGQITAIHRKVNLPTYGRLEEQKYFAKGRSTTAVDLAEGWKCGGLICADIWDPGLLYLSSLQQCTVLCVPVASAAEAVGNGFSNQRGWDVVSQYSALLYGLPILRCNWVGSFQNMTFWGGSAIYGPDGKSLETAGTGEAFISAELLHDSVVQARMTLPTTRTLSVDVVERGLQAHRAVGPS